jgi:hypothetical protein
MPFQLSSVVNLVSDAEKLYDLFLTYNGTTHKVEINHAALDTPEAAKETLVNAVGALLDAYVSTKAG